MIENDMDWERMSDDVVYEERRHPGEQHGPIGEFDTYIGSVEMKGGDGGAMIWKYVHPVSGEDMLWLDGRRALDGSKWEFHVLMSDHVNDTLKTVQSRIHRQRPASYPVIHEMWYETDEGDDDTVTHEACINQRMDIPHMKWEDIRENNWYNLDIYFNVYSVDID
jgi:hypothetical protein